MTPIEHFEAVWKRCDLLASLYAYLDNAPSVDLQPDEVLRAEWVTRISALDLFIHELIAQNMLAIFEGRRSPTPGYLRFQITNEIVERIRKSDTAIAASAAFDLYVRGTLARITYQYPEDIADGVRLCSAVELWNEVASRLGASLTARSESAKTLKKELSLLVRRRNIIAHEGDLQQSPLREPWPIGRSDLEYVSDQIEKIVRAIDAVV